MVLMVRRGPRINTNRFPKRAAKAQASRGVRRRAPPGNVLDFHSLKSPFLDFIVIQTGYWPDSNLGSVFIIKIIFIMKNVTDFRKTVETGVDPRLMVLWYPPYLNYIISVIYIPTQDKTSSY